MSLYINTRGKSSASVALCDRCQFKFALDDLSADRDSPGLRVCDKCNDLPDPYLLPARKSEKLTPKYPRPEQQLIAGTSVLPVPDGEPN